MPYKDKRKKNEFQNQWLQKRRQEWLAANGPCKYCGSWENLEVDHIDPNTKVEHKVWSWAKERREEELAKCQVLCKACHAAKTFRENTENMAPMTHHGYSRYRSGCRCEVCKAAYSVVRRRSYVNAVARKQAASVPATEPLAAAG